VGAHFMKDAFKNYLLEPLKDIAVKSVTEATGMEGAARTAGSAIDKAMHFVRQAQMLHQMYNEA
jgi:hypothetical protein